MDVVVQFAIHRLGFQPQDIIVYAWSIGGFTGTTCPPPPLQTFVPLPRRGGDHPGVGSQAETGEVAGGGGVEGALSLQPGHQK